MPTNFDIQSYNDTLNKKVQAAIKREHQARINEYKRLVRNKSDLEVIKNFLNSNKANFLAYIEDNKKNIFEILFTEKDNFEPLIFFIYSITLDQKFFTANKARINYLLNDTANITEDGTIITYLDIYKYGETLHLKKSEEAIKKEQHAKEKPYAVLALCASLNILAINVFFTFNTRLNISPKKTQNDYFNCFFINSFFFFLTTGILLQKITNTKQDIINIVKETINKSNTTAEEQEKKLDKEILFKSICEWSIVGINTMIFCFAKYIENYFRQDKPKDPYSFAFLIMLNIVTTTCILEGYKQYTSWKAKEDNKKYDAINKLLLVRESQTHNTSLKK
jgi:hypothetical protein